MSIVTTTTAAPPTTRSTTTLAATGVRKVPDWYSAPAGLTEELTAKFPASFGGLKDTRRLTKSGRLIIDIFVVGDPGPIEAFVHPDSVSPYSRYWYVMRPARHSYGELLTLKDQIDRRRTELKKAGASVHETGIQFVADGPRVVVFLFPDTATARRVLTRRFGADTLMIVKSRGFVVLPSFTPVRS